MVYESDSRRLFSNIERFGDSTAIIDSTGSAISYRMLLEVADQQMRQIAAGRQLVAIEARNELLPLATYIGAVRAGHCVLVASSDTIDPESRINRIFKPACVFRSHGATWSFERRQESSTHALHPHLGILLSTSGSTGSPKLVRLSHENLLSNATSIAQYLGISADDRACTTLPWSYSYGLSVVNSHLTSGASIVLTEQSVSSPDFWRAFTEHRATSFAGVPYTYELLERAGFLDQEYPSLRYYTQAGGRLPPETVIRFAEYAERRRKQFFVMYGQTEATARMAYMPPDRILRFPRCIGQAIPGGHFCLRDERGEEIIEAGCQGELVYSGPNVMMGYASVPEELAEGAALPSLRTGDIALRNDEGFYEIVGRSSRFLKIFGLRIALDDVESLLNENQIPSVVTGDDTGLVIAIVGNPARTSEAHNLVAHRLGLPKAAISVTALERVPHLDSGKIDFREILKSARAQSLVRKETAGSRGIRDRIGEILGVPEVNDEDNFLALGGSSLNYVEVSLLLEERLGHSPQGWENMPLRELEAIARERGPTRSSWIQWISTDIFVRAIAIILVVVHHVTDLSMGGSAMALLAVAGFNFARFQTPKLIAGAFLDVVKPVILTILPMYYGLITLYFVAKGSVFWPQYFLISNFTDGFFVNGKRVLTTWWFIEVYIWVVLLFAMLFQTKILQRISASNPWLTSLLLYVGTILLREFGERFPQFSLFYDSSPFMLVYLFAMGWCIFQAKSWRQRLITTIVILGTMDLAEFDLATELHVPAILLLIWIPEVPMIAWANRILAAVAAASLYIYMTHGLLVHPVRSIVGNHIPPSHWLPVVVCCLMAGILIRWAIGTIGQRVGRTSPHRVGAST